MRISDSGRIKDFCPQHQKTQHFNMTEEELQTIELLNWYDRNRRILPWREDPTPYHVWLSEIMLQQTRVEAGKAYYLCFLETLPDIAALAAAPEETYLKLWEGLGYYSRVRNLHKAAVMIMEQYGGEMPGTASELEKLPGIGPYSAAAIASIAFGQSVVSVDGNLLRVFARMTEYGEDCKNAAAKKAALSYYEERIPAAGKRPGDFNQALMDLGAGICLPNGEPLCGECPWEGRCLARQHGRQQEFPVTAPKKARKIEKRTVLLLIAGDRIAIRKRPHKGLLADLYEFPNVEGQLTKEQLNMEEWGLQLTAAESESWQIAAGAFHQPAGENMQLPAAQAGVQGTPRKCDMTGEMQTAVIRRLPEAKHIFSHIEWHMTGYEIHFPHMPRMEEHAGILWVTGEELENQYSIPSAFEVYRKEAKRMLPGT